jgi:predicted site-specific integrase-resolvase
MTAAQINDLSPAELKSFIQRGIIKVVNAQPFPTRIEDTPEYKKFKHLKGVEIHVAEAARKYNVHQPSITRWKQKGFIKVLRQEGQKIYLDESYVAYCVYVFHQAGGQGGWAFNPNGTPRPQGVNLRKE